MSFRATATTALDALRDRGDRYPEWMQYGLGEGVRLGLLTGILIYTDIVPLDMAHLSLHVGTALLFAPIIIVGSAMFPTTPVADNLPSRTMIATIAAGILTAAITAAVLPGIFAPVGTLVFVGGATALGLLICTAITVTAAGLATWSAYR